MPAHPTAGAPSPGIGLRPGHYDAVLAERPAVGFLEVHSENYFGAGGRPLAVLDAARRDYPVSLHGVGLSLGSADPLNREHLRRLKALADRVEPMLVSDHLAWSSIDGRYLNDLLPLPYTEEILAHVAERVRATQDFLGRRILIENPSTYLQFEFSPIPEWEFITEVARRSGCGILLDVNNVYVSAVNHGYSAGAYLEALPPELIGEMHLAGHSRRRIDGVDLLIDTHDRPVGDAVWRLYARAVERFPAAPTLIEWDTDLPELAVLVAEARVAACIGQEACHARAA